ncbi:endonuclease/exonuclease/phosphatase family protein [Arthrobacter sp. Br18]|uniref:endonuclease/exonuclease/phosphatase family protein n=1 Tax=Arthrobacter sp. Br18 TaxID=1312954 RepID=UPI0004B7D774|nr:endonuclease/exonuclease/phosphatase family protein [Arthrobacter sp. Br18]
MTTAPDPPLIGGARTALHVMSYNIRYDRHATQPGETDYWPERILPLQRLLRLERPAVLGVQEALSHQLTAVEAALPPHFRMIGYGRDGGSKGEYSAILYDAHRLQLLEWDQFWLSETPRLIGSITWGNGVARIVTWGRFFDTVTRQEILVINTHFDHDSDEAKLRSAHAILDLVRVFQPRLPTILTGDFNSSAGSSSTYGAFLESGLFLDTWAAAAEHRTPTYGTTPRYGDPVEGGRRIDWILSSPDISVLEAAINTTRPDGRYPSDHAAVQALVLLPDAPGLPD